MRQLSLSRHALVAATALVLVLATPFAAQAKHQVAVGPGAIDARAGQPAFTFSSHSSFPRVSYSVTIYGNGAVTTTGAVSTPVKSLQFSADALNGLLRLAQAEKFFAMPQTLGEPVGDTGSNIITIHTTTQTKTVIEQVPSRNTSFDQLFAVLKAVAGVAG